MKYRNTLSALAISAAMFGAASAMPAIAIAADGVTISGGFDSVPTNWYSGVNVHNDIYAVYMPEPGTIALLGLGVTALLRRRRK